MFPRTVRQASSVGSWKTNPMDLLRCDSAGGFPSINTVPDAGSSRPPIALSSVVFPPPLGPDYGEELAPSDIEVDAGQRGERPAFRVEHVGDAPDLDMWCAVHRAARPSVDSPYDTIAPRRF